MLVYFISYATFAKMKVIITSATNKEILQIRKQIVSCVPEEISKSSVSFHISGVGMLASCFTISKLIFEQKPDLILQVGIAGSFDSKHEIGRVVVAKSDCLGDMGVEEEELFKDVFDMELAEKDNFPFSNKRLQNSLIQKYNLLYLAEVNGITVNEVTTKQRRIQQLKEKYNCEIESMEGAALHYCCLQTDTSFLQIRSISNQVGERDKRKWNVQQALNNLTTAVVSYVEILTKPNTDI